MTPTRGPMPWKGRSGGLPSRRPAALSGGEKKIASFLRALITEPTLVFLDEPTLSIDHAMTDKNQPDDPRAQGPRRARS